VKTGMGGICIPVICKNEKEMHIRVGTAAKDTFSIKTKKEMQNQIGTATRDATSSSELK
jgi:hypothetical protein